MIKAYHKVMWQWKMTGYLRKDWAWSEWCHLSLILKPQACAGRPKPRTTLLTKTVWWALDTMWFCNIMHTCNISMPLPSKPTLSSFFRGISYPSTTSRREHWKPSGKKYWHCKLIQTYPFVELRLVRAIEKLFCLLKGYFPDSYLKKCIKTHILCRCC